MRMGLPVAAWGLRYLKLHQVSSAGLLRAVPAFSRLLKHFLQGLQAAASRKAEEFRTRVGPNVWLTPSSGTEGPSVAGVLRKMRKAPRFQAGKHLERPIPDDFERAADALEWVFYLPPGSVTQDICARDVARALRDVVDASFANVGNPLEVKLAWQIVMDAMGSQLFSTFVRIGAWKDFCPPVSKRHNTFSRHVLWVGQGKRVVLRLSFKNDVPVEQKLWVEDVD